MFSQENTHTQSPYFLTFMEPRNRLQGMNSVSLCSLAGRYANPIPTRFLVPVDCLKIPAQETRWVPEIFPTYSLENRAGEQRHTNQVFNLILSFSCPAFSSSLSLSFCPSILPFSFHSISPFFLCRPLFHWFSSVLSFFWFFLSFLSLSAHWFFLFSFLCPLISLVIFHLSCHAVTFFGP